MQLLRPGPGDDPSTPDTFTVDLAGDGDRTTEQDRVAAEDRVVAALGWPQDGPRWTVRANMVASVDGGTTVRGRSGPLGTPVDQKLIGLQRDLANVILVGAGTVIAENYPGIQTYPKRTRRRERWGVPGLPRWAIVASRSLPADLRAVTESAEPTFVISPDGVRQPDGAEVIRTGPELDLAVGLSALADRGRRRILCEGGPTLLGRLAAADLLDEISLTVSPTLLGTGSTIPLLGGVNLHDDVRAWELASLFVDGDHLFPRYRRRR